jgi:hypothetical protein
MAQTQTPALWVQAADSFPDSSSTTRFPGDIAVVGSTPLFVLPTDPNLTGVNSYAAEGILDVPKDTSTFSGMDAVYWNATGNPVVGTAGTGCATSTASGNKFIGRAIQSQLTGDTYCRLYYSPIVAAATAGGAMTADSITGTSSTLPIAGQAGASSAGGTVTMTGGAGNGAGNAGGAVGQTGGAGAAHTTGTGGAGGAAPSTGGAGGTATSGTGGAGGAVTNTSGAGGNASTSGTGGASGAVGIVVGAAGTTATGTGGAGGTVSVTGGAGGAASGAAGIGGAGSAINIVAGAGGATASSSGGNTGVGGAVTMTSGASGNSAATGAQAAAAGGAMTLAAGASGTTAGTTANGAGGAGSFTSGAGGASTGSGAGGAGGAMTIAGGVGGAGSTTGTGGAAGLLSITGGNGGATSGAGTGGAGASVDIRAGTGGTTSGGTAGANGGLYLNRGVLAAPQIGMTLTALGTVQSSTPTSAQLLGGLLTQTSATGAGTITLPTGTALSAACPRVPVVGDVFDCKFINIGGSFTLTVTGATGTTVVGGATIATAKSAILTFYNTGANTWNIYTTGG